MAAIESLLTLEVDWWCLFTFLIQIRLDLVGLFVCIMIEMNNKIAMVNKELHNRLFD